MHCGNLFLPVCMCLRCVVVHVFMCMGQYVCVCVCDFAVGACQVPCPAPTYEEIKHLVNIQKGIEGLLNWWEISHGQSLIYRHIARRVLSLPSVGSMAVERVAKPLKHMVMTHARSHTGSETASLLLRVGLNLRFLQKHREALATSSAAYITGKIGLPHMAKKGPTSASIAHE